MFEEPNESAAERSLDPAQRAKEKAEEFCMYAELGAVFEGPRKFDAQILPGLSMDVAREVQKGIGRLEKVKIAGTPVLPPESAAEATALLGLHQARDLSANDYHLHRRPGEVMIVRWIEGEQVEGFYERMQAHFDVALESFREEERQALEWKKDAKTTAYLSALDAVDLKPADRYLREAIRKHGIFVLSTVTTDELNIAWLCEDVMGMPPGEFVGEASAPPDDPQEKDLTWFFKLFALRGMKDQVEAMCFFAFLQKTDEGEW